MTRVFRNKGYSLVELVFTLLVIMLGLGSLYGVMHRGLSQIKAVGAKDYAAVAAASQLEYIKAISEEKSLDNYAGPFKGDINLSALNDAKGVLKIRDFKGAEGRLKRVTATVTWTTAGRQQSVTFSTLVGAP